MGAIYWGGGGGGGWHLLGLVQYFQLTCNKGSNSIVAVTMQ